MADGPFSDVPAPVVSGGGTLPSLPIVPAGGGRRHRHDRAPFRLRRPQKLYVVLAGIFLTALVVAEATAAKFFAAFDLPFTFSLWGFETTTVVMTTGVIAFPITFIVTDLINEYYGRAGIRFVSFLGAAMIVFMFVLLRIGMAVPVADGSPVSGEAFNAVFGASQRIIFGSLAAFLLGQLLDIALFFRLRKLTGGRHLWLRATGSTLGSQLLDTAVVLTIAFWGQIPAGQIVAITLFNYGYKLLIAIGITPLIYAGHRMMDAFLGDDIAEQMLDVAAAGPSGPRTHAPA